MKLLPLVFALLLLLVVPATAQIDPDPDGIGIYLDPCGCSYCCPLQPGSYRAYLSLTNVTSPSGVSGWEAMLPMTGPVVVTAWNPRGFPINVKTPPEFQVGLGYPLEWWPTIIVMDIELQVLSSDEPIAFYVQPIFKPSIADQVIYADGADPNILKPLQTSTGAFDTPVLVINGDCPVAGEQETWGGVKAMYR